MLGIVLVVFADALREFSDSVGKRAITHREISVYSFGFLTVFFATLVLLGYGFFNDAFRFSYASLPTLVPRLFLEVLQAHVMILAVEYARRSDYGFVRTLTIPLLLLVDITLGYKIGVLSLFGIVIILSAIIFIVFAEGVKRKGIGLLLFSAINAVATISLYKYNITYFNSVAAEESIANMVLLIYFWAGATYMMRENPFSYLTRPRFLFQSTASGVGAAALAAAYLFAPASIILTASRSSAILFSLLSGRFYFHEGHFKRKLGLLCVLVCGLVLLAIGT